MIQIAAVEDDTMMHGLFREMFAAPDFSVKIWSDGTSAIAGIPQAVPDVILLDVNLPDMDGHDVCAALKKDERTRDIPVLMLTGEARQLENRVRGLELGAEDYLFKPVSAKLLIARIKSLAKTSGRKAL